MTKTILTIAVLAALSTAAAADVNNAAISGSTSSSASGAVSGAYTGQSNSANSQNLTINHPGGVNYSGGYDLKNVGVAPDMISTPTAPCRVAVGVSGGIMGGALGIGGSILDEGCDAREDARLLHNLGKTVASIARLCAKPEMKVALGVDCPSVNPTTAGVWKDSPKVAASSSGFKH